MAVGGITAIVVSQTEVLGRGTPVSLALKAWAADDVGNDSDHVSSASARAVIVVEIVVQAARLAARPTIHGVEGCYEALARVASSALEAVELLGASGLYGGV